MEDAQRPLLLENCFVVNEHRQQQHGDGNGVEKELQTCVSAVQRVVSPILTSNDNVLFMQVDHTVNPELPLLPSSGSSSTRSSPGAKFQDMFRQENRRRSLQRRLSGMMDDEQDAEEEEGASVTFCSRNVVYGHAWSQRGLQLIQLLQYQWGTMMLGPSASGKIYRRPRRSKGTGSALDQDQFGSTDDGPTVRLLRPRYRVLGGTACWPKCGNERWALKRKSNTRHRRRRRRGWKI